MKHKNFFDGVSFGTVVSSSLILSTLWVNDLPNEEFKGNFIPLLTTAATLAAGYLAVSAAVRTIKAQSEKFEEIRLNKLEAAKSTLPLVLSLVIDVSHAHLNSLQNGSGAQNLAGLDNESLATLKECIEHTTGITRKTLRELIAAYQICRSRHNDIRNFLPANQNGSLYECYQIYKRAVDWIALESIASVLFDFSRGRAGEPNRAIALDNAIRQVEIFVHNTQWSSGTRQSIIDHFNAQKAAENFSFANPDWLNS